MGQAEIDLGAVSFLKRRNEISAKKACLQVYTKFESCQTPLERAFDKMPFVKKDAAYFEEAISIPNNSMLQTLKFNEIVCYEHLGQFERARGLMDIYINNYPDDENARDEYTFLKTR